MLAGPNGAGKTTLLRGLLGFVPCTGLAQVLGRTVGSSDWRRHRREVGYVKQGAVMSSFPLTAREVVEIGVTATRIPGRATRDLVWAALKRTGASGYSDRPYAELSGGEKQRVALARCLCQDPRLLLLDEPTASLDPEAKGSLIELLSSLPQPITVLMATHEESHLENAGWPVLHMSEL
jgi:ABC-type Mn2+/Zn2+ transport system ATPase subunit